MANNTFLKQRNMLEIIKIIKNMGNVTKPEIVKATGFTQSTVHSFIIELLEKDIIHEEGIAESNGGRKAVIYRMNEDKFKIFAVDIGDSYISVCISNLDFKSIYSKTVNYKINDYGISEGFECIIRLINSAIDQSQTDKNNILGIGVSVSGTVDFLNGKIYQITNSPKWCNIPLAKMIEDRTGINTIIDKDNNNAVLYYKMEDIVNKSNIVFLSTRKGIGTGVLIEGNVYRGSHFLAGEFGHIRIDSTGAICKCGRTGCIEPLASDPGIVKRFSLIKKQENISLNMVIEAAKQNDEAALDVLNDVADNLTLALSNVIRIYDPSEIIIDCIWLQNFPGIYNTIIDNVYEDNNFVDRDNLIFTLSKEDNILLLGATALVLDHHLNSDATSKFLQ